MALNQMGMGLTMVVRDKASGRLRDIRGRFVKTGDAATQMGRKVARSAKVQVGAIGSIVAAAAGLTLALTFKTASAFGKFEQGIAKVGAISQASEEDLARLGAAAKQAGIDTQFSPVEATEGLANLAQAGFDATRSMELLTPVLDLAAGGQISLAQSSATVAAAVKAFGLEGKEAAIVADKLLKISNVTALSANDLQLAIGNVSRGAGVTKQSLEEMLPAIGLVRNTGVEASVASSSVSSALLMMAKNARKFKGVGVEVTDAQGKFRPFLDVVLDTSKALEAKFPNAAKRAAKMTELFGRFGLTAANAIGTQLADGITVAGVEGLKGADAIAAMRAEMEGAEGTAAKFKEQLLNTFEGQKTLLKGSAETLLVAIGETFAAVFRPLIEGLISSINKLIKWIDKAPPGLKKFIASVLVVGTAIIGVVAAIAAAISAAAALGITLKLVAILAAAVVVVFGAVALAIGVAIGFIKLFKTAYEKNLGGFRDFVDNVVAKVTLAWDALGQLFSEGVLSGKIRDEMLKAENQGLLAFVTKVFAFVEEAKALFEGIGTGIERAFDKAGPTFERLVAALTRLGEAFGFASDEGSNFQGDIEQAGLSGEKIGEAIGDAFVKAVDILTELVDAATEVKGVFDEIMVALEPIVESFGEAGAAIGDLASELGFVDEGASGVISAFTLLAKVIGSVIVFAVTAVSGAFRGIVTFFRGWINTARGIINVIAGIFTGDWSRIWKGAKQIFFGFVQGVLGLLETLVGGVAGLVDALGKIFGKKFDFAKQISGVRSDIEQSLKKGIGADVSVGKTFAEKEAEKGPVAVPFTPQRDVEVFSPEALAALQLPAAGPSARRAPPIDAAKIGQAVAGAVANVQIQTAKANLNVDGNALGEFTVNFKASTDKAGGKEVPVAVD